MEGLLELPQLCSGPTEGPSTGPEDVSEKSFQKFRHHGIGKKMTSLEEDDELLILLPNERSAN